jgi:peptidoglycan/LPS O-acetylase OafA/YrhL
LLRIFAVLWVISFHWFAKESPGRNLVTPYSTSWLPELYYRFTNIGWLGVDIFFVFSGAVISKTALQKNSTEFAIARFLRIFPAYFIAVISALVVVPLAYGGYGHRLQYAHALFGMQFWTRDNNISGVSYTLKYEIVFYFLIFLAIIKAKKLESRTLLYFASIFLLFSGVLPALSTSLAPALIFFEFGPYFTYGIALANMGRRNNNEAFFLLLSFVCMPFVISSLRLRLLEGNCSELSSALIAWCITISLWIIALGVRYEHKILPIRSPKSIKISKVVSKLSLMTYPMYLLHAETGQPLISFLVRLEMKSEFAIMIVFVFLVFFSFLIVQSVEPLFRRKIKALFLWP